MAKNTWVNIAGTWKKVTNVWENVAGTWKQKVVPWGNIAGVWKDFIQYMFSIYDNGVENVAVVEGYHEAPYSFAKEINDIKMRAWESDTTGIGDISTVTDTMIDLTNYTKVKIEFTSNGDTERYLIASPNKLGSYDDFVARAMDTTNSATKVTIQLDVSALTGSYYIRIHQTAWINGSSRSGYDTTMYLYRLWLE